MPMTPDEQTTGPRTFRDDLAFLQQHTEIVVLGDTPGGPRVAVAPAWQGRVMTSAADGAMGIGYGWLNETLIASGEVQPHINALGGEDRFWLGPEGGQFSIFFTAGDPFDLEHWQTPPLIDTDAYDVVSSTPRQVTFQRLTTLTNYSNTTFDLRIDRTVRLLDRSDVDRLLGIMPGAAVLLAAYESDNTITNTGADAWTKETGLLSVWILGMFKHSPETTVVMPYREGAVAELGPVVNDAYFGEVPADRLVGRDGVLFFKGDGQYRSKIGVSPQRALPVLGSFDASRNLLTIVQYTLPEGAVDYVNSMWELQDQPYAGDAVNSYNDGPPEPGSAALGPFYELETSSPAAALGPDESITHVHRTFHFEGPPADLESIAQTVLGVDLTTIRGTFQ